MPHLKPAHHETSKRDSANKQRIKIKQLKCPVFEFKPHQVNDSSQSNHETDHLVSQIVLVSTYCPHLQFRYFSRGGPISHCCYPAYRVPPHTSLKSRQGAGHPSTRCYASRSSGPCLHAREGSGAATRPATPDPASSLGRAPVLPRVLWLRTLPPCSGGLWRCHATRSSGPHLPAQKGFSTVTRPTPLYRSWIKKC
jgi:hypothetical protein